MDIKLIKLFIHLFILYNNVIFYWLIKLINFN